MKLFAGKSRVAAAGIVTLGVAAVGAATAPASGPDGVKRIRASAPPTVTAAAQIFRTRGGLATTATLATVSDDVTPAGDLVVSATPSIAAISVTNVVNTNGTVTGDVSASCSAGLGNKNIAVSATDGDNQTTSNAGPGAQLVTVQPNSAPDLAYPSSPSAPAGQTTMINPTSGPTDNGTVTSIVKSVGPAFVSVDGTTGVVSATPSAGDIAGSPYTVTIDATDNCNTIRQASFSLSVGPATALKLLSLSSHTVRGGVQLRWRTAQELGLLGFNVYRLLNSRLVKANVGLIRAARGGTASGHAYWWVDRRARGDERIRGYRLQAVGVNGTVRWLGSTFLPR